MDLHYEIQGNGEAIVLLHSGEPIYEIGSGLSRNCKNTIK